MAQTNNELVRSVISRAHGEDNIFLSVLTLQAATTTSLPSPFSAKGQQEPFQTKARTMGGCTWLHILRQMGQGQ